MANNSKEFFFKIRKKLKVTLKRYFGANFIFQIIDITF